MKENFESIVKSNGYFYGKKGRFEIIFDGQGIHHPYDFGKYEENINGEKNYFAGYNVYPLDYKNIKKYNALLLKVKEKLNIDRLFIPNFKKIGPKVLYIPYNKSLKFSKLGLDYLNVGFTDGLILDITTKQEKIGLGGFVGDCAAIVINYKNEILGILHAGWPGTSKGVIETFVCKLKDILDDKGSQKSLSQTEFYISPMAGDNFELPKDFFEQKFKSFIKNNKIKYTDIFRLNSNKKGYGYLNLRKAIKIVLRNNGIDISNQVWFHPDDTTNPNNFWPSYRLYNNGLYPWNDRLATFGIINNK